MALPLDVSSKTFITKLISAFSKSQTWPLCLPSRSWNSCKHQELPHVDPNRTMCITGETDLRVSRLVMSEQYDFQGCSTGGGRSEFDNESDECENIRNDSVLAVV